MRSRQVRLLRPVRSRVFLLRPQRLCRSAFSSSPLRGVFGGNPERRAHAGALRRRLLHKQECRELPFRPLLLSSFSFRICALLLRSNRGLDLRCADRCPSGRHWRSPFYGLGKHRPLARARRQLLQRLRHDYLGDATFSKPVRQLVDRAAPPVVRLRCHPERFPPDNILR